MGMSRLAFQTFPDQVQVSGTSAQSQAGATSRPPYRKDRPVFSYQRSGGREVPPPPALNLAVFLAARQVFAHFSSGSGPCKAGRRIHRLSCGPHEPTIREPQAVSFVPCSQAEGHPNPLSLWEANVGTNSKHLLWEGTTGLERGDRNLSFPQTPLISF